MVELQGESCLFSSEMLNNKVNVHGGFTPATSGSPKNAITPEQVIYHYPISAGAVRGDRNFPLRHLTRALNFIS